MTSPRPSIGSAELVERIAPDRSLAEPTYLQLLRKLAAMIEAAGIDVRTAVRKRESLYGELGLADASDDELLDAMADNPILIERPFVVTDKGTRLARPIDSVREIL